MSHRHMRVRQRLEELEELNSEVARLRRGVQYLETKCGSAGVSRYGVSVSRGSPEREDLWIRLCDQRASLAQKEAACRDREEEIRLLIDQLPKPRWRMVLRCRYLEGMPMAEIPEVLNAATGRSFSISQIYRLHAQALAAAEKQWPDS